ncbi:YdaS family helix-turn-helix protein [Pelagerythrobacter sp.]|uniref:YdaS family helix-turn-helix protein n=1 Tax=Pelagerythrobacter sp. TaxID=2800702 RepID=UPI0035AE409C
MSQLTRFEALTAAVQGAGSQSQFARDLAVSQPTVWRWINQSKQLPAEHVLNAERLYGVSRHDLRPDIYPRETMVDRGTPDRFVGIDLRARTGEGRQQAQVS